MSDSKGKKDSFLPKINNLKVFKMPSPNINSLLRHVGELRRMFSIFEIDVFAVNESKINRSVTDNEICISGTICVVEIAIDLGVEWLFIFERIIPSINGMV